MIAQVCTYASVASARITSAWVPLVELSEDRVAVGHSLIDGRLG